MKKLLLLPLFIFLTITGVFGQYYLNQNKVWAFGDRFGLDFNSGKPLAITSGIRAIEGNASVCDKSGKLLFYTDGEKVYNSMHMVMPSGSAISTLSTISTQQAAIIAPVIGNPDQYYIFSLGYSADMRLAYSIVDMTLAGGMGDVIAVSMGTIIEDSMGENMITIPGYNNDLWLVCHKRDTSLFLSFNITKKGISAPVISNLGPFNGPYSYAWGILRASTDRKKIAQGLYYVPSAKNYYGLFMYDFNPADGKVSSCITIDTTNNATYGVEFSPDGSKLYASGNRKIMQYDISLPTISAIQSSRFMVTDSSAGTDIRLGPDTIMYFRDRKTPNLHAIAKPNLAGIACAHIPNAVIMPLSTFQCFPNLFVLPDPENDVLKIVQTKETADMLTTYPNPVGGILHLKSKEKIFNVVVVNIIGAEVYKHPFSAENIDIDISHLPAGTYFLSVNQNGQIFRFIKQ